jgi:MFS transporter, FHS family, Na+ dependent glucose transporter 1
MADNTLPVEGRPVPAQAVVRDRRISRTAVYYAAFILLGMTYAAVGPTIANLAQQTHSEVSQVSYLLTARWLGYLIGSLIGGRLYDRYRGHFVIAGMLVLAAVTTALVPAVPMLWVLVALLVVYGIGAGAVDVGGNTLLIWVHDRKVGPWMNALHFFYGLGAFIAPLIVAQVVLRTGDFRWAYWLIALLAVPAVITALLTPSPARQTTSADGSAVPFNGRLVALFALFLFLVVAAESSFADWISPYSLARGLSDVNSAYVASVFWGALMLARLFFIPVAARVKPNAVLLSNIVGCAVGAGVILLAPGSVPALAAGAVIFGLSVAVMIPSAMTLAGARMHVTGRVTGWFLVGASLGGMTMPRLIGQMFVPVGPWSAIAAILVSVLAMFLVYPFLARQGPAEMSRAAGTPGG